MEDVKGLRLNKKHKVRNDAIYNSCLEEVVCAVRKETNYFETADLDIETVLKSKLVVYEKDIAYLQNRCDFCGINATNGLFKRRVFLV